MNSPPAAAGAVLIDALGTLVGIEPPFERLRELLASRFGVAVALSDVVGALRAEMAYYRDHCVAARDAATLATLRAECTALVARELGEAVARLDRDALSRTLLDSLRFAAYPEAAGALRGLRARGARVVVASNWDISLGDALEQAGLAGLVDGVVCSASVGAAKPAAAVFEAALAVAGLSAGEAIHVGDRYDEDVLGARGAGIEPVLLVRTDPCGLVGGAVRASDVGEVRTIASLAEL